MIIHNVFITDESSQASHAGVAPPFNPPPQKRGCLGPPSLPSMLCPEAEEPAPLEPLARSGTNVLEAAIVVSAVTLWLRLPGGFNLQSPGQR